MIATAESVREINDDPKSQRGKNGVMIGINDCTMVENRQNSLLIIHFPTSEGVSEVSERANT